MRYVDYLQNGGGKYDVLKFTLAILIVLLHTRPLSNDFQPLLRIAVPIFFIMTSFFFFKKIKVIGKNETDDALRKFIVRNLKLYLFWFVLLLPVTLYRHNWFESGVLMGIVRMIRSFLFGSTFAASWYIIASVIAVAIITYTSRYINNLWLLSISLCAYLFCSLDSNYHHLIDSIPQVEKFFYIYHLSLGVPYISYPLALVWVVIGKIIAENQIELNKQSGLLITVMSVILLFFEHYYTYSRGWILDDDCYLSLLVVCPMLFITISQYTINIKSASLLRKLSTMIYCSHLSLLTIIELIFECSKIDTNRWTLFFLCLASASSLSFFILWLEERFDIKFLKYSH